MSTSAIVQRTTTRSQVLRNKAEDRDWGRLANQTGIAHALERLKMNEIDEIDERKCPYESPAGTKTLRDVFDLQSMMMLMLMMKMKAMVVAEDVSNAPLEPEVVAVVSPALLSAHTGSRCCTGRGALLPRTQGDRGSDPWTGELHIRAPRIAIYGQRFHRSVAMEDEWSGR